MKSVEEVRYINIHYYSGGHTFIGNFQQCTNLRVMCIPTSNQWGNISSMNYFVAYCDNLEEILEGDVSFATSFTNAFAKCINLRRLGMKNISASLSLADSPLFTREALLEVLNNLTDLTGGTTQTLTLGSYNLSKLTDADKAIATNKNWTLA